MKLHPHQGRILKTRNVHLLSRYSRLSIFGLLLLLLVLSGFRCPRSFAAAAADASRWNILFVFADDWGRYSSCYAKCDPRPSINDVIKTPNVDRVAREGVL